MASTHFGSTSTAEEVANSLSESINGKVILATGVSPGSLGAEAVRVIAKHPHKLIILAGRSARKLNKTKEAILQESPAANLRNLDLDLGSLQRVREAAAVVNSYSEPCIDVLINSAAIMASSYSQTTDGFESQFGTNHLGPFLFTNLIMPKLLAASNGARVVVVSSDGHAFQPIRFDDPNWTEPGSYDKWKGYGQGKTANVLFAKALADKLSGKGMTAFSLHPGVINTNLAAHLSESDFADLMTLKEEVRAVARRSGRESTNPHTDIREESALSSGFKWKTLPEGAATYVVAAFDPTISDKSGEYLQDCQIDSLGREPYAIDPKNAEKLWSLSEQLVGQKFSYE